MTDLSEIQAERHTQQLALLSHCSLSRVECELEIEQLKARQAGLEHSAVYLMGDDWGGLEHDYLSNMIGTLESRIARIDDENPPEDDNAQHRRAYYRSVL
jgi:hypothetical protein